MPCQTHRRSRTHLGGDSGIGTRTGTSRDPEHPERSEWSRKEHPGRRPACKGTLSEDTSPPPEAVTAKLPDQAGARAAVVRISATVVVLVPDAGTAGFADQRYETPAGKPLTKN